MTLDRISLRDGIGQTLLLAENLNGRNWGWQTETPGVDYLATNVNTITGVLDTAFIVNIFPADFSKGTDPGIVNFAFCDGRAKALNQSLDVRVYLSLMTSGGARRGQLPIGDSEY